MKMKTTLWTKMLFLTVLLCAAVGANASSLTISGGDGNSLTTRFQQLSVGLTATVNDPPQETTEATITGPTYQWSGGGSGLSLTVLNVQTTNLDSGFPPSYGGSGQKSVTVNCTATFISKDKKTGKETPVPVSNSKTVQFFVRVPQRVDLDGAPPIPADVIRGTLRIRSDGSIARVYQHYDDYNLKVLDNQTNPQGYGQGLPSVLTA